MCKKWRKFEAQVEARHERVWGTRLPKHEKLEQRMSILELVAKELKNARLAKIVTTA